MASLTDIMATLQNGVVAIQELNTTMQTIFPQATAFSTTGALPGSLGYISVVTSSGATVRLPVYA